MDEIGATGASDMGTIGVGGGAYSNTVTGRVVIRNGRIAPGLVRTRGHLSCELDQAIVTLQPGDEVITFSGPKGNCDMRRTLPDLITPAEITELDTSDQSCVQWSLLWQALETYHNRDGYAFVGVPAPAPVARW